MGSFGRQRGLWRQRDGPNSTGVETGFTFTAEGVVNYRLAVHQVKGTGGTDLQAGAAAGTLF
jgi:hypothetical protein